MKQNVHSADRGIRLLLAAIILSAVPYLGLTGAGLLWLALPLGLLATGLVGYCPLYALLGLRTLHSPPE